MIFVLKPAMNIIIFGLIFAVLVVEGMLAHCSAKNQTFNCGGYCLETICPVLGKTKILHQEFNKCHQTQKKSILERLENMKLRLATNLEERQQKIDSKAAEILNTFSNIEKQAEKIETLKKKLKEKLDAHSIPFESRRNSSIKNIPEKFDAITQVQPPFNPIGSKFYYIEHVNKLNWFKAGDKCRELGGHLFSFQSQEEFDAVRTQLKPGTDYWIDLNDLDTEGEFVSIVTGLKPKFTNWHKNEPHKNSGEHCGDLWYTNKKHLMNDDTCSKETGFICELAKKTK